MTQRISFYESVGGEQTFVRLVDAFYRGVEQDPLLRPMYPEEDLTGAKERLTLFLIQYFGGPNIYSQRRGHPRLRLRHLPFAIGLPERDAWMRHMTAAMEESDIPEPQYTEMMQYFREVATVMINQGPAAQE